MQYTTDVNDVPVMQDLPPDLPKKDKADIYKWIVMILGGVLLAVVVGGIVLSVFGKTMPEAIMVLGSVALGFLGSLLKGENNA